MISTESQAETTEEQNSVIYPTMVFVIHGGPLEAKSALLAASLAEYYLPGKVVARIMEPEERWSPISSAAATLLDELGVEVIGCRNEIDPKYPHGNKITALKGISGPTVFLDSDILLMAPFSWHYMIAGDSALKPADLDTFQDGGGSWARVWELFDMDPPEKSYRTTVSDVEMRPYFNAGFISVRDGDSFAKAWLESARTIDADERILNKRPWLDQIALPVALARLGWKTQALPDAFNYPCHLAPLSGLAPYFAHYHWPSVIAKNPQLLFRVQSLIAKHPSLKEILGLYEEWHPVLKTIT